MIFDLNCIPFLGFIDQAYYYNANISKGSKSVLN